MELRPTPTGLSDYTYAGIVNRLVSKVPKPTDFSCSVKYDVMGVLGMTVRGGQRSLRQLQGRNRTNATIDQACRQAMHDSL